MPRVLIVEDEAPIRDALAQIVEAEGLEAVEAEDGAVALEIVKSEPPDVILLDIHMPNVGGMEFLKLIRADESLAQLPVIVVTAKDAPDNRYAAMKLGIVDYISIPWMPGEIELRVKWALKSGSTIPAVPWDMSGAAGVFRVDRFKLRDGDAERDVGSPKDHDWSPLTLPEGSETEVVTPEEGGWLETKDGRVRVTLPAGAVRYAMALSASPADLDGMLNPASLRVRLGDEATDLTLSDRTGSPIWGVRLDRPMEISLRLDRDAVGNGDDPSVFQVQELDNRTHEWSDVPTRVDMKNGFARVRKLQFPQQVNQQKDATVLVISDVRSEQEALYESLDWAGYDVLIEPNPYHVIATIINKRPDVVLLDIAMRRLNGITVLRQIKGDPSTRYVTVITLGRPAGAGHDNSPDDYERSLAVGARDMIVKPWHPGDLQARVARAVDASRARMQQAGRAAERAKARRRANRPKAA